MVNYYTFQVVISSRCLGLSQSRIVKYVIDCLTYTVPNIWTRKCYTRVYICGNGTCISLQLTLRFSIFTLNKRQLFVWIMWRFQLSPKFWFSNTNPAWHKFLSSFDFSSACPVYTWNWYSICFQISKRLIARDISEHSIGCKDKFGFCYFVFQLVSKHFRRSNENVENYGWKIVSYGGILRVKLTNQ